MQRNTVFFIAVKALHVSGGFPAHHQELKDCTRSIWYVLSLVFATANVVEMELRLRPRGHWDRRIQHYYHYDR
jgi:hypothetical protein